LGQPVGPIYIGQEILRYSVAATCQGHHPFWYFSYCFWNKVNERIVRGCGSGGFWQKFGDADYNGQIVQDHICEASEVETPPCQVCLKLFVWTSNFIVWNVCMQDISAG